MSLDAKFEENEGLGSSYDSSQPVTLRRNVNYLYSGFADNSVGKTLQYLMSHQNEIVRRSDIATQLGCELWQAGQHLNNAKAIVNYFLPFYCEVKSVLVGEEYEYELKPRNIN